MPASATRYRKLAAVCALYAGLMLTFAIVPAKGQENSSQSERTAETSEHDLGPWKLINTAIFAALLGWFLVKYSPRFFNARSADIQRAIKDATGLKIDADFRYSEIDKKMARLGDEVNKIREQAAVEIEREHERIRQQTQTELERIHQNAANEIEALRKEASDRVQRHTAEIALGLAERRLQDRFSQGEPGEGIDEFIRLVEQGKN